MQNCFFIRHAGRFVRISFSEILYAQARKNYTKLITLEKTYVVLTSLKSLETILPAHAFCRIHRGFLISLDKLTSFDTRTAQVCKHEIPIGSMYGLELQRRLLVLDSNRLTPDGDVGTARPTHKKVSDASF